jgi:Polysaccharide lyase
MGRRSGANSGRDGRAPLGRHALVSLIASCCLPGAIAPASAEQRLLLAPASDQVGSIGVVRAVAPGKLFFAVNASPCARKAIFYVDQERRWVDHSYRWWFGRDGYLRANGMEAGSHRLAAHVVRQDGTVVHSIRTVHLTRGPSGSIWWTGPLPHRGEWGAIPPPQVSMVGPLPEPVAPPTSGSAPEGESEPPLGPEPTAPPDPAPFPQPVPPPPPQLEPIPPPAPEPTPPQTDPDAPPPLEPPTPEPEPGAFPQPSEPALEAPSEPAPQPLSEPAPEPEPEQPPAPQPQPSPPPGTDGPVSSLAPGSDSPTFIEADFEDGLSGWSTAGVGDVVPTVVSDIVRTGEYSGRVVLSGTEVRSELILAKRRTIAEFPVGTERYYAFSFYVCSMVYGRPGAHNLVMQLKSDNEGSPRLGLQLWDYQGKRGLWSHGEAMGSDRFLAPIAHQRWHDVVVHFKVTGDNTGFYRVYLDGALIDSRNDVSVLRQGASTAYIKSGLYRNGDEIPGFSEIRLDSATLGTSLDQVAVE